MYDNSIKDVTHKTELIELRSRYNSTIFQRNYIYHLCSGLLLCKSFDEVINKINKDIEIFELLNSPYLFHYLLIII